MGLRGAGGVKNFRVGICDGAPSTARSSFFLLLKIDTLKVLSKLTSSFHLSQFCSKIDMQAILQPFLCLKYNK